MSVEGGEHLGHPDAGSVLKGELDIQRTKRLQVGVHGRPWVAVDEQPQTPTRQEKRRLSDVIDESSSRSADPPTTARSFRQLSSVVSIVTDADSWPPDRP